MIANRHSLNEVNDGSLDRRDMDAVGKDEYYRYVLLRVLGWRKTEGERTRRSAIERKPKVLRRQVHDRLPSVGDACVGVNDGIIRARLDPQIDVSRRRPGPAHEDSANQPRST
jgi:hypothetical protein